MWRKDPRLKFGYGLVAYLVWVPLRTGGSKFAYAETVVPQHVLEFFFELRAKKTFICVLEELGIAAPYFAPELEDVLANTDVIHFADNVAANTAVIKGGSSAPDMARIVAALHIRLVSKSIQYVYGSSSINRKRTSPTFRQGASSTSFVPWGQVVFRSRSRPLGAGLAIRL